MPSATCAFELAQARRLRMGAAVMVAARPQAGEAVGVRLLPYLGSGHPDPGARHVRALLSHGLRRQDRDLRRYVHGGDPLEQRGAIVCSNDGATPGNET